MDFSRFFIDRPIFAAVLSIIIFAAGLVALPSLPIGEYPEVVPPSVVVRTVYPGAMSSQSGAKGHIAGRVGGNNADLLGQGIINLPLFAYMRDEEVDEALAVYGEALGK